ncbi:MAG: caspase family protein [Gammaproteobacteria bacterium]|nr:caspase family protein [Gammaproteobacteria bacterium]
MHRLFSQHVFFRNGARAGMILILYGALCQPVLAEVPITTQTTDCEGATGFASFDAGRLYKIQAAPCPDPEDSSRKLQQVLLISDGRITNYEVLTVTADEAKRIVEKLQAVSQATLEGLTGADIVIEQSEGAKAIQKWTPPTRGEPAATTVSPPRIVLIDPPVSETRSINNILTSPSAGKQLIVGRVRSDAEILSLTVNGEQQTLNSEGLFTAEVRLTEMQTPVNVVAVDKNGQRSSVEFRLLRETPSEASAAEDPGAFGRYHALVIANNSYTHFDDLATPADDANAISEILRDRYGFETHMLYDATRYDMLTALNEMRANLTENDNLLIYFAGHGAYDNANHRGHWLPVDAEHDSTANWVSTIDITDLVNAMSARHVLVVADSCYSGALTRAELTSLAPGMSENLRQQWLRAMAKTRSRHLFTSGGVKPVVDDGGSGHSIFANALIQSLGEGSGIIESSALFRKVKQHVVGRAEELQIDQTPQYAKLKRTGHEYGEFMFVAN